MREGASPKPVFFAGETITVSAGEPAADATTMVLLIDFFPQVVEVGSFPGTLVYTFPADGVHTEVFWEAFTQPMVPLPATWVVSCTPTDASPGCNAVNSPSLDATYERGSLPQPVFFAGETITVSAGEPAADATTMVLLIDFFPQVVEVGSFPGTLAYTFPADGVHTEVFSGGVHPAHGSPPCDVGRVVYARS